MTYKDDPKVKIMIEDLTEEKVKDEIGDDGCADAWYSIIEYDGKYAVDYNFYIDGYDGEVDDYSTFYGCFPDKNGYIILMNLWCEERYNINFSDPKCKDKLIEAAYKFLINEVLKEKEE